MNGGLKNIDTKNNVENYILDDVLWIDFSAAILNEAFRSPDHKTFFLVLF